MLAVLLLFPFHTLRVFNADDPFYVKAAHLSAPLSYVLNFISVWHMPLLFVLAGASTYFALGKRSPRQYLRERRQRLLVPLRLRHPRADPATDLVRRPLQLGLHARRSGTTW